MAVAEITHMPTKKIRITFIVNLLIVTFTGLVTKPKYIVVLIRGMFTLPKLLPLFDKTT